MHTPTRRLFLLGGAGLAALLAGCAGTPDTASDIRPLLAPTGRLRVGVYPGGPTSMVQIGAEMHGLAVDAGRELARRIGVPADIIVFPRVAEVVDALKAGHLDFTITNASPARQEYLDFTPALVALELGYLSLPGSPVQSLAEVDRPGIRIGVTEGSTSLGTLTAAFKQARVVTAPSLEAAAKMLTERQIDAFATNKSILYQLSDTLPGARVLEGRWGLEHLAIALPKGRGAAANAYVANFAQSLQGSGFVQAAAARAQLRGLAAAP